MSDVAIPLTNARRWSIVGLLFTASLINYFDRATISFALPLISTELHLGPEAKGVLLSAFFWSYALLQIPMGVLADRVNLRWLYAAAFTLWSISQGLDGIRHRSRHADRLSHAARGRRSDLPAGRIQDRQPALSSGGARASLRPVRCRHAHRARHRRRARPMDAGPFRVAREFFPRRVRRAPVVDPLVLDHADELHGRADHSARSLARPGFGPALAALVTNRNLLGVCLTFFCFDYYWYFLVNWLPDYLVTARGLTILHAGLYAALPYFVFGASEPIGGWIADRLIRRGVERNARAQRRGDGCVLDRAAADSGCARRRARRCRRADHWRLSRRPGDG